MLNETVRITFGIIVLNGEPFTRYNLRSLYPFAHEIIVVEGASPKAKSIATPDGHSVDRTLEVLYRFKKEEDIENKLTIVTAEDHGYPNGFWPGEKDEQSQAYADRATGDYLWQVDIDEFYKPEDMRYILDMISASPDITQINFYWLNFWGGFDYLVDGLFLQAHYRALGGGVPRLFKWGPGYRYVTHRPPTVVDANSVDLRNGRWMKGNELKQMGINCYHYATIFPNSVNRKMQYYSRQGWKQHDALDQWYQSNFMQIRSPFRIHHVVNEISWISRFEGIHPIQIQYLISDLMSGELGICLRDTSDIERLLSSRGYQLGVFYLKTLTPLLLRLRKRFPRLELNLEQLIEKIFSP